MLQITTQQRLLLATKPIDFRKGITGLAAICKAQFKIDPFSGILMAFTNRSKTAVKLLCYDGNGFWLAQKRFSEGRLAFWPSEGKPLETMQAQALQTILAQGDPQFLKVPAPWRNHTDAALTHYAAAF